MRDGVSVAPDMESSNSVVVGVVVVELAVEVVAVEDGGWSAVWRDLRFLIFEEKYIQRARESEGARARERARMCTCAPRMNTVQTKRTGNVEFNRGWSLWP